MLIYKYEKVWFVMLKFLDIWNSVTKHETPIFNKLYYDYYIYSIILYYLLYILWLKTNNASSKLQWRLTILIL